MAGTGNDYIGKVSVTRSNRTCQTWASPQKLTTTVKPINATKKVKRGVRYHRVDREYLNGSLYADMSAEAALNFCRNPSRSIAG